MQLDIAKSSPLYEYWNSDQDENDENERLSKLNQEERTSNLFRNEPYKWENLYQSTIINLMEGDESSLRGLMVLLSTLSKNEKDKCLNKLETFLDNCFIYRLKNENYHDIKSNNNIFKILKVLFSIFSNPYGLEIRNKRNRIYEKTGMFFYNFLR